MNQIFETYLLSLSKTYRDNGDSALNFVLL